MTQREIEFYGTDTPPQGDTGHAIRALFEASDGYVARLIERVAASKIYEVGNEVSVKNANFEYLRMKSFFWKNAPYLFQMVAQELIAANSPQQEDTTVDE